MNMARLAVSIPFSRIQPAGNAIPAWKKTQTLRIQKVLLCVQPCASERIPPPNRMRTRTTLMAIIAAHGRYTMSLREWPRMSRSVSPTRYTRPLGSVTSRYATAPVADCSFASS